jgi:hypothetical protein
MYNTYDLITSLKNEHVVESKKIFNSLILKRCNELIEQRKEELKNEIFNEERKYVGSYKVPYGPSGFNANLYKETNGSHILLHPGHGNKVIEKIKSDKDVSSHLRKKGYHRVPNKE